MIYSYILDTLLCTFLCVYACVCCISQSKPSVQGTGFLTLLPLWFFLSIFSDIQAIKEGISGTAQEGRLERSDRESDVSSLSRVLSSAGMNATD